MLSKYTESILAAFLLLSAAVYANECAGQSCYIAWVSGSTNKQYDLPKGAKAAGASASGEACVRKNLEALGVKTVPGNNLFGKNRMLSQEEIYKAIMAPQPAKIASSEKGKAVSLLSERAEEAESCSPTMLLYARGTMEPGDLGISIGPKIKKEIEDRRLGWKVRAITSKDGYDAALSNNFCVGLPGGKVCRDVLQKVGQSCPTSNFILAGYSQGAMVARICAAYVTPDIQKRIKGLVLFGDPMNGADVKGISSDKVNTICNLTGNVDGVCKGEFNITMGHLAYSASQVKDAVAWAAKMAKGS